MAVQKPSIPKGTRDFSPEQMLRRNYMFDAIREQFKRFGFLPLETPSMENLSTLMGKYGEEGDKLLFKILNSGEFNSKVSSEDYENSSAAALASRFCEKGLRYDLTVPFARYVVQHQNELSFPFRRFQIQPVWRADRPQKGRYREFYQCDVDIIGSNSLINECELIQIVERVFTSLNIAVTLKMNNRKILFGIAQSIGHGDKMMDITIAIDKLDKIGMEAVCGELSSRGIEAEAIEKLKPILELSGTNAQKLEQLKQIISASETGLKGIEEMETIFSMVDALGLGLDIEIDLSLARGLNYYTGAIFEVKAKDFAIGSICGGGRYDDLTGIFGMPNLSGVGISFGADRIYDVLTGLDLFPDSAVVSTKVLFINFGQSEQLAAMRLCADLRSAGVASEIYPDTAKMKKQMEYANKRAVPYVVILGESELSKGVVMLKNMTTGEQRELAFCDLVSELE